MKFLRIVNWIILGMCLFVVSSFIFGDESMNAGNSSLAALMVVIALTSMIWVPIGLVTSIWSLALERKQMQATLDWFKNPALYVLGIMLLLLSVMFG